MVTFAPPYVEVALCRLVYFSVLRVVIEAAIVAGHSVETSYERGMPGKVAVEAVSNVTMLGPQYLATSQVECRISNSSHSAIDPIVTSHFVEAR
jgi:hypothetical protein